MSILTSDPVLELVIKSGCLLSLTDVRAVAEATGNEEIQDAARFLASACLTRSALELRAIASSHNSMLARLTTLIQEFEARCAALEVPTSAIRPSLDSPLCSSGSFLVPVAQPELAALHHALRTLTHPAAWPQSASSIATNQDPWLSIASSTSSSMRPTLALTLATILSTEARLSYLGLKHAAYKSSHHDLNDNTLGAMVARIVARMATAHSVVTAAHLPRVIKSLRQIGPFGVHPLSLYVLRNCSKNEIVVPSRRSVEIAALEDSLLAHMAKVGDALLFSHRAWLPWLFAQEERHLVCLYIKFLYDGFQ